MASALLAKTRKTAFSGNKSGGRPRL